MAMSPAAKPTPGIFFFPPTWSVRLSYRPPPKSALLSDPVATFEDLQAYLRRDGWDEEPNLARGRLRTGDHRRFRKELADGTMLRTKLSHRLRDDIGPDLFRHIADGQNRHGGLLCIGLFLL